MTDRFLRRLLASVVLVLTGPALGAAQEISGLVTDATGGALPGAIVSATEHGTELRRTTLTNDRGYYVLPALAIGEYEVAAELPGFKRFIRQGVIVRLHSRVAVDAILELGGVAEQVTVEAGSASVDMNTGQIGRFVAGEQIGALQLNGRNFSQLLWLNPGVSRTVRSGSDLFGGFGSIGTGQSINGGRTSSQSWNIDGVDNKDNGGGGNNFVNVNPDAIAEFNVLTTNFSAEYGQNAGAVVNVALKSGTQQFRGLAYEYLRNDRFDARAFNALTKPVLRYNNVGGNIGGPVSFRGFNPDKTKLFFFGGVDFKRQRLGTPTIWTVPSLEQRRGDFSARSKWPDDPETGEAVPGGIIPPGRISPNAKRLIDHYPAPNFTGPGGNFQFNNESDQGVDEYFVKFDYVHSPRHHLNLNYLHDGFASLQNTNQLAVHDRHVSGFSASIRWKAIPGPAALNVFQVSASGNRIVQDNFRSNPTFNRDVTREGSGITYPLIYGASRMIPSIIIEGPCCTALNTTAAAFQNFNHVFQVKDDFSTVVATHNLKAGVLIIRSLKNQDSQPPVNGVFTFDDLPQALFGRFDSYQEGGAGRQGWFRFWQHELYAVDNWRATPRLSLELGVRYSLLQPQHSVLNNAVVFFPGFFDPARAPRIDPQSGEIVGTSGYDPANGLAAGGERGLPDTILPWQGGIAPRVSFAYDLLGNQTLLRGGYGRYFERIQGNYIFNTVNNPPFVLTTTVSSGHVENPTSGEAKAIPPNVRSFDIRMKLPVVDNWSVGLQRRLWPAALAEAAYVGAHGFNQTRDSDLNQLPVGTLQRHPGVKANALRPHPGYAFINQYVTDAEFSYHSLQALLRLTFRDGGMGQIAYTFSRALTTATNWNTLPVDSYHPTMDEGRADYDRPHVLVASYVYPLPFWRTGGRWYRTVLGGWRVSGVTTVQSGLPLNITMSGDPAGIGRLAANTGGNGQRPDVVAEPALPSRERTDRRWFNTNAFQSPNTGTFGNAPRNAVRGPGSLNTDLSLHKRIPLRSPWTAELRVEAFNVFNHANAFAVGSVLGTASFGQVTQFADPRIIQLALRLNF